jgi:hypothetical protein
MKTVLTQLKAVASALVRKAKIRKGALSILAAFFVLQLYFVRELLAAELIFGIAFAVFFSWAESLTSLAALASGASN